MHFTRLKLWSDLDDEKTRNPRNAVICLEKLSTTIHGTWAIYIDKFDNLIPPRVFFSCVLYNFFLLGKMTQKGHYRPTLLRPQGSPPNLGFWPNLEGFVDITYPPETTNVWEVAWIFGWILGAVLHF